MKNPLSKTEITGLVLLAVLIVAITGCALLIKGCTPRQGVPEIEIVVVDTVAAPASTSTVKAKSKAGARNKRNGKKKRSRKSQKAGVNIKIKDPFSDTIPQDTGHSGSD